ncbi:transcriptional regulator swi6 [Tilletia horrida]|uniref:Transcriptional regulator swi6 n=1 Tax=Tilletia horrida TaxID=155126 RepID=A0AAN6JQ60_9BASI|nr:transcriptional regulator swi6 [Tilletia horrida]
MVPPTSAVRDGNVVEATGPGPSSADVSAGPPPYNPNPYQKHLQPPTPPPGSQPGAGHASAPSVGMPTQQGIASHYAPNPTSSTSSSSLTATAAAAAAAAAAAESGTHPLPPHQIGTSSGIALATPSVYLANYSGVPVFEMTVRGIAVMRRRSDGFLNATQILKVAGVEKGRRTKILEKEILNSEHDKVQGGYGKYQGTWLPLQRAQELSAIHNVSHILKPLLLLDPATETSIPNAAPRRRPNPNAPHQSLGRAAANATAPAGSGDLSGLAGPAGANGAGPAWDAFSGLEGIRGSAPTQQPRFIALRSPAPTALGGDFLNGATQVEQAQSQHQQSQQQEGSNSRLEHAGEDVFGPLTTTAAAATKSQPGSATKRSTAGGSKEDDGGEPATKKARGQDGQATRPSASSSLLLGPSPVKDLNALHPSAGLLQAASHPGAAPGSAAPGSGGAAAAAAIAAVRASAWTAANSAAFDASGGSPISAKYPFRSVPRYADRPRLPRASDEGERRAREVLIHLFVDDGSGSSAGVLGGWNARDATNMASAAGVGSASGSARARQNAVKTPAEIAAAARAPFVFGAAAVGAAKANATPETAASLPGHGGVLSPEVARRKLDELLSLLVRAVGLDGFEDAIASASASAGNDSVGPVERRGIDLDIVTDDHGHTVLHWAAALGRLELVSVLTAAPPVLKADPSDEKGKQREPPAMTVHGIPLGGANPNAGNYGGETALQRTVLVVNAWEHGYFPQMLRLLAPSLMTRDFRGRTVLHHIALVSGLRGRAASARYYLECVLEFAREVYGPARESGEAGNGDVVMGEGGNADREVGGEGGRAGTIGLGLGLGLGATPRRTTGSNQTTGAHGGAAAPATPSSGPLLPTFVLENLVDAQDEDGETALGIVARLGNAGLVKILLDAGARKDLPNLLGIRASDWGLEMVGLGSGANGHTGDASMDASSTDADATRVAVGHELAATRPQDIMTALGSQVKRTPMKSSDILESISHSLEDLTKTYTSELAEKNSALEAVQGMLKQATRDLANRRRDVSEAQGRADKREETLQRLNNLTGVLSSLKLRPEEEEEFNEQSGGKSGDGDVSMDVDGADSNLRVPLKPIALLADVPAGPGAPRPQTIDGIVRTRFVASLLERECQTLEHAISEMDEAQALKESQYRRLVSICSGVPERNVVEMLDELVLAIESDGADVDLDRLAGFLDKVQHPRTASRITGPGAGASDATGALGTPSRA